MYYYTRIWQLSLNRICRTMHRDSDLRLNYSNSKPNRIRRSNLANMRHLKTVYRGNLCGRSKGNFRVVFTAAAQSVNSSR